MKPPSEYFEAFQFTVIVFVYLPCDYSGTVENVYKKFIWCTILGFRVLELNKISTKTKTLAFLKIAPLFA